MAKDIKDKKEPEVKEVKSDEKKDSNTINKTGNVKFTEA